MMLNRLELADGNPVLAAARSRVDQILRMLDERTGTAEHLAGDAFTTADIMSVFTLTTMRYFQPIDLSPHRNILKYLARIANRSAYRLAMKKGDPSMVLLLA